MPQLHTLLKHKKIIKPGRLVSKIKPRYEFYVLRSTCTSTSTVKIFKYMYTHTCVDLGHNLEEYNKTGIQNNLK